MCKPTCLIIQSGAMSDVFIVAPIAKFYHDKGYTVFWPVREHYFGLLSNYFPYVNTGLVDEFRYPRVHKDWLKSDTMHLKKMIQTFHYDLVVDTSDRDVLPDQRIDENFEEYKYRVAGVPFAMKNHLSWDRDLEKEQRLIAHIEDNYGINIEKDRFIVTHGDRKELPKSEYRDIINMTPIITEYDKFEIVDWFPIIAKAEAVYCVESATHQFIDGCINKLKYENEGMKFYLIPHLLGDEGDGYAINKNWSKKYMR